MSKVIILIIIALITLALLLPIAGIFALNTLFVGTLFTSAIPLNLWTYLSMMFCLLVVGGSANAKVSNN